MLYSLFMRPSPTVTAKSAHTGVKLFQMSWRCAFRVLLCRRCGKREEKIFKNVEKWLKLEHHLVGYFNLWNADFHLDLKQKKTLNLLVEEGFFF